MLSAKYNLLTLKGLAQSDTYFDKLPKDLVWYLLGYTGPKDGFVVLKKNYFNMSPLELVKATTVHTEAQLETQYTTMYYSPQYVIEPVKFVFIDGKQYAAIPIKRKIEGFTPTNQTDKKQTKRCTGLTTNNRRCKRKIHASKTHCKVHATAETNDIKIVTI